MRLNTNDTVIKMGVLNVRCDLCGSNIQPGDTYYRVTKIKTSDETVEGMLIPIRMEAQNLCAFCMTNGPYDGEPIE